MRILSMFFFFYYTQRICILTDTIYFYLKIERKNTRKCDTVLKMIMLRLISVIEINKIYIFINKVLELF